MRNHNFGSLVYIPGSRVVRFYSLNFFYLDIGLSIARTKKEKVRHNVIMKLSRLLGTDQNFSDENRNIPPVL